MRVDFTKIKLVDIDGNEIVNSSFHKTIANAVYTHAKTLDLVELAMKINKGKVVEIDKKLLVEVKNIIESPGVGIAAFARKTGVDWIDSILSKKEKEQ